MNRPAVELLTVKEFSGRFGLTETSIRRNIDHEVIPSVRRGRSVFIPVCHDRDWSTYADLFYVPEGTVRLVRTRALAELMGLKISTLQMRFYVNGRYLPFILIGVNRYFALDADDQVLR